jgi:multiple sugar transport system substrate-binding protein
MKKIFLLLVLLSVLFLNCSKKNDNQIILKVAHPYDPMGQANLKESYNWFSGIAEKFTKDHPNVKVEFEIIKWDEIDLKFMSDFRTNISHDVVITSPQHMAQHNIVGDLLDIAPYIERNKIDFEDMRWSPVWNTGQINEKYFGLPLGIHTRAVAYRRDYFQKAGLNPDNTPKNLDELLEYAQKLTLDTNRDGKTDVWGLGMYLGNTRGTCEVYFSPLIWHFGGDIWDSTSKRAVFSSDAGVRAAQFIIDLIYKYKVTPEWALTGTLDDVLLRPFLDGKYAMGWGWGTYWIQSLEEQKWVKGIFPATDKGIAETADIFVTPTKENLQFENSWDVSIHKLSKNPDLAFEFIKYLFKPEDLRKYPDAGLPIHRNEWNRPEMQTPFYKKLLTQSEKGKGMPKTAHYAELAQVISSALQEILINKSDIKTTLKKFEDEYNSKYSGE